MSDDEKWLDDCERRLSYCMKVGTLQDIEEAEEECEDARRMYRLSLQHTGAAAPATQKTKSR